MTRRSPKNRELVRLTPVQFSVSVSIVVLLLAAAGIAGFFYGRQTAAKNTEPATSDVPSESVTGPETDPARSETTAPVTFYTVLTEPRRDKPETPGQPEPSEEQPEEAVVQTPARGNLSLTLQVASYRGRETAGKLLEKLSADGYAGTIQVADLGERGIWYRVRIGPYGNEKEARGILEKLRKERGLKGYVVR